MIPVQLIGSDGKPIKVNGEGEIGTVVHTHPPRNESIQSLPFRSYFLNGASNDMRVDGSSTPVEFSIDADADYDYFIKSMSVKLSDPSAKLDKFGNLTALTNGVSFRWESQEIGELTIHDGIKDNLEFFRLSKQKAEIIDLSGGGADAIVVTIDLAEMFGNPWGVRLTKGTTERLVMQVNDNLGTGIVEFNIIGYGVKI
jgi:hypothetical protein